MKAAVSTTVYDAENRRKERTAGATIREARRKHRAMCNQVVMVVSNHVKHMSQNWASFLKQGVNIDQKMKTPRRQEFSNILLMEKILQWVVFFPLVATGFK